MQIKLMLLLLLLTTGLVTNFSGCITKDSFPSIPPYFLLIRYNFIKVLQISALHEIEDALQSVSKQLGSEFFSSRGGNSLMVLFDQYRYLKQPKQMCDWDGFQRCSLCCFKVLFGSHYRALAPLLAVPEVNVTPNYRRTPLVVIKCRHRPNAPYF